MAELFAQLEPKAPTTASHSQTTESICAPMVNSS
jgi:hypothetical protein